MRLNFVVTALVCGLGLATNELGQTRGGEVRQSIRGGDGGRVVRVLLSR